MKKAYLGIDPGKTGAACLLTLSEISFFDYSDPGKVASAIQRWSKEFDIICCIEKVHAMPKQGVSSTFKFGVNYGIWIGTLASFKINYREVTPQKWQLIITHRVKGQSAKERSLAFAKYLYPKWGEKYLTRKKDHDRADAILIATYAKFAAQQTKSI